MGRLVVISNRVPASAARAKAAGGLETALTAALRDHGGLWFGWSGEIADAAVNEVKTRADQNVTYTTLDLSQADYDAYYSGFANQCIWPLFHYRTGLAATRRSFAEGYYKVNARFAEALWPLLADDDALWVHDYHLIPLGHELRQKGARHRIGFFLHIPWPATQVLNALPGHQELVKRMFAYDVVGFQTPTDMHAFIEYVITEHNGVLVSDGRLACFGKQIVVRAFPIGCDAEAFARNAELPLYDPSLHRIRESIAGRAMIIGVDRLDYSKGLDRRLRAFGFFLDRCPEYQREVFMLQIAPASRSDVPEYRRLRRELEALSGKINGRYAHFDWVPIRYVNRVHSARALASLYRASRVAMVTPMRDGMNLVAKEYIASQDPHDPGVLILSRFAGAAHQMKRALIVNPFDEDEMADALKEALGMPKAERIARWEELMHGVRTDDVHAWWKSFVAVLERAHEPGAIVQDGAELTPVVAGDPNAWFRRAGT